MKRTQNHNDVSGIILLAKQHGKTSFSSLSSVKRALGTTKVGHTGTLDSFADGLLVVLVGSLTHLVPHITNFDKTYLALIEFGTETDTLDPTGEVIKTGKIPTRAEIEAVLPQFVGEIDQVPPAFSALHVDGKRASDLAREGKNVELKARKITISSINLREFHEKYALIEVSCSKGTYIRSLARDIAEKCGTVAHLVFLRRTRVGAFELKDAVGAENLADFTIENAISKENRICEEMPKQSDRDNSSGRVRHDAIYHSEVKDGHSEFEVGHSELVSKSSGDFSDSFLSQIRASVLPMTPDIASLCGLDCAVISSQFVSDFNNGRFLNRKMFVWDVLSQNRGASEIAVFYPNGDFAGVMVNKIVKGKNRLSYGFVIKKSAGSAASGFENLNYKKTEMKIYSWEQIAGGKFSAEFKNAGTALTIGSFDGSHLGHKALFDAVLSQKGENRAAGVLTFTRSLRGYKNPQYYEGDVVSLSQKIESFSDAGFDFAVIVDFSEQFGKIKGRDFLAILAHECGMKFLAEGSDFHCGYKGLTGIEEIKRISVNFGFAVETIDSVIFEGERVSSSRIRKCVLEQKFSEAQKMMKKPFELDCTGFQWQKESESVIFAQKKGGQLVPPNGNYSVRVVFYDFSQKSGEAQNNRAAISDCTLENGNLRLAFSDNLISGFVRSVQFL